MRRFLLAVSVVTVVSVPGFPGAHADTGPRVESCGDSAAASAGFDRFRTTLWMPCDMGSDPATTLWAKLDRHGNPLVLKIFMKTQVEERPGQWTTKDKTRRQKTIWRTRGIRHEHAVDPEMIFAWSEHHRVREVTTTYVCNVYHQCHRERAIGYFTGE